MKLTLVVMPCVRRDGKDVREREEKRVHAVVPLLEPVLHALPLREQIAELSSETVDIHL